MHFKSFFAFNLTRFCFQRTRGAWRLCLITDPTEAEFRSLLREIGCDFNQFDLRSLDLLLPAPLLKGVRGDRLPEAGWWS